jgi:hypothetical protein
MSNPESLDALLARPHEGAMTFPLFRPESITAGLFNPAGQLLAACGDFDPARCDPLLIANTARAGGRPLEDAARAFGLSGLEARVAVATIEAGSIRAAAAKLDLAYQTAREAMAGAMRRVGVARLPALVTRLAEVGFGVLPEGSDDTSLLADVWGITPRQATLGVAGPAERVIPCLEMQFCPRTRRLARW